MVRPDDMNETETPTPPYGETVCRVAVVHGNTDVALLLGGFARKRNLEVKTAATPATAATLMERFEPHVVFLDPGLGPVGGDGFLRRLKDIRPDAVYVAMLDRAAALNRRRQATGDAPLQLRIGINTGPVVVGNMGSRRRLSYTAVGAAVNLAARLESAAPVGGILISQHTRSRLPESVAIREVPPVRAKGFPEPVPAFLVLPGDSGGVADKSPDN